MAKLTGIGNGTIVRFESQLKLKQAHTKGCIQCPACAYTARMLTIPDADLSVMTFSAAIPIWKEIRNQRMGLKPRTHESTDGYLSALEVFFGELRLKQITAGHLREYQLARRANALLREDSEAPGGTQEMRPWKRAAGNSTVNHEIAALGQILAHCKLWAAIKPYYSPFGIPSWSPRDVLNEDEEEHLFKAAAGDSEALLAYLVAVITNNTSAAGCELRGLRLNCIFLRELDLDESGVDQNPSEIYIPPDAVKNNSRPRKIPLNPTARWAIAECMKRALKLGSCRPEHYLFPFRVKRGKYDPARPPSRWWLRNSWNRLREITGFKELRPHDMRHQCITRLLEEGTDPELVRSIAGHVNPKMMEYYSHIRRQAKYAAVMRIDPAAMVKKRAEKKPPQTAQAVYAKGHRSGYPAV